MNQNWSTAQHDEIERWAYRHWEERGRPFGSPDVDWFRAQEDFLQRTNLPSELPFSSMMTEPIED